MRDVELRSHFNFQCSILPQGSQIRLGCNLIAALFELEKDFFQHDVGVGADDFLGRFLFKRSPFNHALQKGESSLQEKGEIECRQYEGRVSKEDRPSVSLEHADSQEENC
ncbi:hypothetical protein DSECCO2_304300 [anaerobic digester metagenome]